jgi:hypothetical protein
MENSGKAENGASLLVILKLEIVSRRLTQRDAYNVHAKRVVPVLISPPRELDDLE